MGERSLRLAAVVVVTALLGFAEAAKNSTVLAWQYQAQQLARDEKLPHQVFTHLLPRYTIEI